MFRLRGGVFWDLDTHPLLQIFQESSAHWRGSFQGSQFRDACAREAQRKRIVRLSCEKGNQPFLVSGMLKFVVLLMRLQVFPELYEGSESRSSSGRMELEVTMSFP